MSKPGADSTADAIHQIIDKATTMSVAFAGVLGNTVQYDSTKISRSKQKEVNRFLHLFNSQTVKQRLAIIWQMFSSSPSDDADVRLLRAWLKEIAEIMQWTDEDEVCELLGVCMLEEEDEARRKEQDAEANLLMDKLDIAMGMSSPTSNDACRVASLPSSRRSPSPAESDVSRTYYDVEEGYDKPT